MLKRELEERLEEALELLSEALEEPRIRVPISERITAFTSRVKEERKTAASGDRAVPWRLATLENPETGREVTLEVRKDGGLLPSDQERTGLEYADQWHEVRAMSRSEARERIAAGEAQVRIREDS